MKTMTDMVVTTVCSVVALAGIYVSGYCAGSLNQSRMTKLQLKLVKEGKWTIEKWMDSYHML